MFVIAKYTVCTLCNAWLLPNRPVIYIYIYIKSNDHVMHPEIYTSDLNWYDIAFYLNFHTNCNTVLNSSSKWSDFITRLKASALRNSLYCPYSSYKRECFHLFHYSIKRKRHNNNNNNNISAKRMDCCRGCFNMLSKRHRSCLVRLK